MIEIAEATLNLGQMLPWGLTIAQSGGIAAVAVILLVGWFVVHTMMRLTGFIFRIGCAAVFVFICGIVSFMAIYNYASR